MEKKKPQEHEFLKERIKKTPINTKRLGVYIGCAILLGVIVGVVAALVFGGVRNLMNKQHEEPIETIVLSGDEDDVEIVVEEKDEQTSKKDDADQKDEDHTDATEQDSVDDQKAETTGVDDEKAENGDSQGWSVADYQVLQNQLYAIGEKANGFVVSVTGVKETEDWFHSAYETEGIGSGIIIAETADDYRIVTERRLISDVSDIKVTFQDDASVNAKLLAYDETTGIAVLSVVKSFIPAESRDGIRVADLGASIYTKPGTIIVAVGSPQGSPFSILIGNVISADQTVSMADANYRVLTTDISGQEKASGALIDTNGRVLGLILQDANADASNTVTALGISDLKKLVEKLSNGVVPVYMGLEISEVTPDVSETYGLPEGIYVKDVLMDSPAMYAGIQTGDIIQSIDGEAILTEAQYTEWILNAQDRSEVRITLERMGADGIFEEIECIAAPGQAQ